MDGTHRAMAAAARFVRSHASRDTGACLPTSCLKMSGQTVRRREHVAAAFAAAPRPCLRHALRRCMDGTHRAIAAAARFARSHASRYTGACLPTSCLKMSGQTVRWRRHTTASLAAAPHASRQLLENERTNCTPAEARSGSVCGSSSPLIAADLARVHGWHASRHGSSGTPRTASC